MDISAQMLIFATVVDQGSISAAARSVGQTPSAVSKQIGLLEDHVHYRLLHRTRTGVSPTQEGEEFYRKCKAMAEKFHEAQDHISNLDGTPRGKLMIASTVAFGKSQLIPALPKFMDANPQVEVSLDLTDRVVDLQADGFDAAICFAEQRKNPDIVVRRLMASRRVLCAAPSYLERRGMPETFTDLAKHNCLRVSDDSGRNGWRSTDAGGGQVLEVQGSFEGNSTDVIFRAALAGLGIARLPFYMAGESFKSGELVHVLPEYAPPSTDIVVMFAERRNLAPKTRTLIDFLVKEFRDRPKD
ncbi:HTH-type transcriptional regulator, LysR family [Sulfitobacter noctilucicola]|uniref:DNA-binding transcriptional LysR family regulator n=1 Tax=Sulfitobacter noctilucicola TaxID=1342301 RepID=A0A7W6M8N9_9RHOB|nr:LysR family transcriptional regulator [Sulfitobacter noctilucicola]KIN61998.1 HTH-type transcriptional regulator, LysR family [Sulfitobacter noctilucicola]MBB4173481.1 DNA-binding transcriptional LysR family regulator [Sulfitobacter noctilucicola]